MGDKLHVLVGGRYDWAQLSRGFSSNSLAEAKDKAEKPDDTQFSPRVGVLYRVRPWLSVYGSYSKSFGISYGRPAPGKPPFPPEEATQYEVGLKTSFWGGRVSSTVAMYQITKTNIKTQDPNNPHFSVNTGEARSRGIELDIAGQITDRLDIIASYAYTNTEVTHDNNGFEGNRLPNVPKHSGSFWFTYELPRQFSVGPGVFTIGSGLFWATDKAGDIANTFELPGYVRWDLMAAYSFNLEGIHMQAQLNVNNVLDERYFAHAGSRNGLKPAAPRTVIGSLRVRF